MVADQDQKHADIDPTAEGQEVTDKPQEAPEQGPSAADASAATAAEAEPQDTENGEEVDQFAELQDELAQMKDMALRAQADAQNVKRRAEMDVEKARKFALESFARDLLPVVDNLERALEAASASEEQAKPIAEGVELTLKSLLDVLKKFKIEGVDPQGEPFDPQLHQAMSMVENPEVEPNTVIAVMQKGYTLNARLLRPAMVMVSKAAEQA
jgi:molecular chaperone GrpE